MVIWRMVRLNGRVEELRARMSGRGWIAGGKMKPGRALLLLTGIVMLLGGIVIFNEMSPNAQASLLDDQTARTTADLPPSSTLATFNEVTGNTAGPPARVPPVAGQGTEENEGGNDAAQRPVAAPAEPAVANPLWGLPLARLSTTRERPIFSASRRPPAPAPTYVAPVAASQPAKPPEPELPAMALVGTIIGTDGYRMAIFRDTSDASKQDALRLRTGESYHGWEVRLISAREASLVKNGEQAVLELPAPGASPPPPRSRRQVELDLVRQVGAD
jgi:hypothetical protein